MKVEIRFNSITKQLTVMPENGLDGQLLQMFASDVKKCILDFTDKHYLTFTPIIRDSLSPITVPPLLSLVQLNTPIGEVEPDHCSLQPSPVRQEY